MQITVQTKINASIDQVWEYLSQNLKTQLNCNKQAGKKFWIILNNMLRHKKRPPIARRP